MIQTPHFGAWHSSMSLPRYHKFDMSVRHNYHAVYIMTYVKNDVRPILSCLHARKIDAHNVTLIRSLQANKQTSKQVNKQRQGKKNQCVTHGLGISQ